MSLIDEALKRAQEEAARQQAIRKGVPDPWAPVHRPAGPRPRRILAAAIGVGAATAGLILAVVVIVRGRPRAGGAAPSPPKASSSTSLRPPITEEVVVPPLRESSAATPSAKAPPSSAAPVHAEARREPSRLPAARPAAARPSAGPADSSEIHVPNGEIIRLDGIVYSEDHPVAILNGRFLTVGDAIEGFTVAAITSEQVSLEGGGKTIVLHPK